MSMKTANLKTYWEPGDAELMINFLDDLRELLVDVYGDEIIEMHQRMDDEENAEMPSVGGNQMSIAFDDEIEF